MKKKTIASAAISLSLAASMAFGAVGCVSALDDPASKVNPAAPENTYVYDVPQDYNRTYYELFVRSFADGNGDGIGDFRGLIDNLDYLNDGDDSTTDDLGINGLWLMPINQSPSYHKYDVEDYYDIDDEYGDLGDFDELVRECDKRGIWLQMDLVLNHTSSNHPWFKEVIADARAGIDPHNSTAMQRYNVVKQNTKPGDGWYYVSGTTEYYYLGNFSSDMPDLNLKNQEVREEIKKIVDFWLERGIRSFRLDAVPWAMENAVVYGGANAEFWTWFNDYCNEKGKEVYGKRYPGLNRYCYNVGEVLVYNNATIEEFFESGMSNFNFSLGYNKETGYVGVVNDWSPTGGVGLANNIKTIQQGALAKDENAILSNLITNHDIDRYSGFLNDDPVKMKAVASLYMLSPGNCYVYYGEEIGAKGVGIDPNKRLPFNWGDGSDRIVSVNPPNADYSGEQIHGSWKSQNTDPKSILTYYRKVIQIRNRFPEISHGVITPYGIDGAGKLVPLSDTNTPQALVDANAANKSVTAYVLTYGERKILIVHNLVAGGAVSLDTSAFSGCTLEATLSADGGKVALSGSTLKMDKATVAVLKV
ncbi:MAG: hypothetical protein J1F33_06080 [Clostridiales bacterium]|nr:hypothetical protein [Clostridiales bacterium]